MKKILLPALLFLLFASIIIINGVLPILSTIMRIDLPTPSQYHYLIIIFSYLVVIATLLLEKNDLNFYNFDRPSLLLLVFVGLIRINLRVPNEALYKAIVGVLGLALFIIVIVKWKKIPKTSIRWVILGVLSCAFAIPIAFVESAQVEKYIISSGLYEEKFFSYMIQNLLFNLSFVAPFEEITVRGVLWGQLRKWQLGENKIFWVQGIFFWLLHFGQISYPTTFFITLLVSILIFSLLVRYSRQIFPSIVSHTLLNTSIPILVMFYTR